MCTGGHWGSLYIETCGGAVSPIGGQLGNGGNDGRCRIARPICEGRRNWRIVTGEFRKPKIAEVGVGVGLRSAVRGVLDSFDDAAGVTRAAGEVVECAVIPDGEG